MQFDILTIFPESLSGFFSVGVLGQARSRGLMEVRIHDLRDFTDDPHRTVDDRPYGGGPGMVMKPEPFVRGLESILDDIEKDKAGATQSILLSSQGHLFCQADAARFSKLDRIIILCGRYEGVDERVVEYVNEEICIGDYVLSGGEAAAAVIVEATCRMVPGIVGRYESVEGDSFYAKDRLGPPQYTRPAVFRGLAVPEVLLSGNQSVIDTFREKKAWQKTARNRPDLLNLDLDSPNPDE